MKILYLDCGMGAAGDMLAGALLELLPDPDAFVQELNALGIPGVVFRRETAEKCGIRGTHLSVTVHGEEEESIDRGLGHAHMHDHTHDHGHVHAHDHDHAHAHSHGHEHGHHHHSSLHDIEHIVCGHLPIPERVKQQVMAVYRLIAEAESHAHGVPVTEIHFHEVGTLDAVADIMAVCLLRDRLSPDEVVASPVHVGSGQVKCAHGILPVPAPATAYILRDVPIYGGSIRGELCTPTGAALLRHFVTHFGDMPPMRTQAIGYGMGKKDFAAANCVRAMLGEDAGQGGDRVWMLACNVDDMTAEAVGFAMERLFDCGALDVYTVPIGMKKSRPGTMLCVLCRPEAKDAMLDCLFRYTTTIGVRELALQRHVLDRRVTTLDTPYGPVRRKEVRGRGEERYKYEYEDLARIAREKGVSLAEAASLIDRQS